MKIVSAAVTLHAPFSGSDLGLNAAPASFLACGGSGQSSQRQRVRTRGIDEGTQRWSALALERTLTHSACFRDLAHTVVSSV